MALGCEWCGVGPRGGAKTRGGEYLVCRYLGAAGAGGGERGFFGRRSREYEGREGLKWYLYTRRGQSVRLVRCSGLDSMVRGGGGTEMGDGAVVYV